MNKDSRCIAPDLMVKEVSDVVPETICLDFDTIQGEKVAKQVVLQFFSGSEGNYFVCMMDFEDWGSERCPRFSYYKHVGSHKFGNQFDLVNVASSYDWMLVK